MNGKSAMIKLSPALSCCNNRGQLRIHMALLPPQRLRGMATYLGYYDGNPANLHPYGQVRWQTLRRRYTARVINPAAQEANKRLSLVGRTVETGRLPPTRDRVAKNASE